jgi:hypothetical protein
MSDSKFSIMISIIQRAKLVKMQGKNLANPVVFQVIRVLIPLFCTIYDPPIRPAVKITIDIDPVDLLQGYPFLLKKSG